MPDIKAGPLTAAELQALWESSVDKSYSKPFIASGEGKGFEAWTQLFAQYERASKAIDVTTQAMFISPWSGQTNPPAGGAAKATVTLTFTRSKFLERGLVLGKGLIYVGEVATDFGENGPEEVETGRRYVLKEDLVFFPGDTGPLEVKAEAERPGYGYNNPLPDTIRLISQPGAVFENDLATVAQTTEPASPEGTRSRATILAAAEPDMFVPEHVGQYMFFRDGSNPGKIGRVTVFTPPDTTVIPNLGSKADLELFWSIEATTFAGTFEVGEIVSFGGPATAYGRVLAERTAGGVKKLAFVLLSGTGVAVGTAITGATSGATATIRSVMDETTFAAETATASWRMLDWATDFGVEVTHDASPEGGRSAMLDELGFERGIQRVPGEDDESYRARVREPADVVSPNAIRRALNRALGSIEWVLREVGLEDLRGFFFDGDLSAPSTTPHGAQNDAYDYDTIAILGAVDGEFDFQEAVQVEQESSDLVYLSGWMGRLTSPTPSVFELAWDRGAWDYGSYVVGHRVMTFIRRSGTFPTVDSSDFRVRGLRSGALMTFPHVGTNVEYSKEWPTRRYRCYLDYEQFRGFFLVSVAPLANGEFGWAFDVDAWDVSKAFDGYPSGAADIHRKVWRSIDQARAGGVAIDLEQSKAVEKLGALTGSVPSAPTAISPNNGSAAGGTSVQITVPSSTGLIGAKVGGVALTGFTIDDATHVSGTTGAHAAGASDVVVTNAFGDSAALVGGYTYNVDPTTDALTSFFRDYGGSPWAGTASAGTSGSRTLTEATNAPAVGTALNGAGTEPASFDGLNDQLISNGTVADYVDVDGFGGWVLVNIAAITTNNDTDNQQIKNQTLWAQTDGYQAVYLRSNGGSPLVGFTMYDGTLPYKKTTRAITTGTWVLVHWRYTNGTGIQIGTNGTWSAAVASNNLDAGALASLVTFGRNYDSSAFLQYDWADGGTWDRAVLDADITNVKAYVNARYGLSL